MVATGNKTTSRAMNNNQIRAMLSEIVQEIDYDIWKEIFPNDTCEEEIDEVGIAPLIEIVKRHLP